MTKMRFYCIIAGLLFSASSIGQSHHGFKKLNGIEYKIVKDVAGPNAQEGDVVQIYITARSGDVILGDSRNQNHRPTPKRVAAISAPGQFEAILPFLSTGDSAVIYVSCDTVLKTITNAQKQKGLPAWMKPGNEIFMTLSVASVMSYEEFQQGEQSKTTQGKAKAAIASQMATDDRILRDYFVNHNIKPYKAKAGLYYTISTEGSGHAIVSGQTVSVLYTGRTLDGKIFDSNTGKTPLSFIIGRRQVIDGWEYGIPLLKKGSKATLYCPSALAYGRQGSGTKIPPNSILIFDLEITNVK